jgi:hypothetical protein
MLFLHKASRMKELDERLFTRNNNGATYLELPHFTVFIVKEYFTTVNEGLTTVHVYSNIVRMVLL